MLDQFRNIPRQTLVQAAILISVSLLAALAAPSPLPPPPTPVVAEDYPSPVIIPPKTLGQWTATLRRNNPWVAKDGAGPGEAAKTTIAWNIVGIVIDAGHRYALVSENGETSRKLGVGDKLPDGSAITAIAEDRLQLKRDGQSRVVSLYRQ